MIRVKKKSSSFMSHMIFLTSSFFRLLRVCFIPILKWFVQVYYNSIRIGLIRFKSCIYASFPPPIQLWSLTNHYNCCCKCVYSRIVRLLLFIRYHVVWWTCGGGVAGSFTALLQLLNVYSEFCKDSNIYIFHLSSSFIHFLCSWLWDGSSWFCNVASSIQSRTPA